jgi:lipid kinase YegS
MYSTRTGGHEQTVEQEDSLIVSKKQTWRLIVNGKSAGDPDLREAVRQVRDGGQELDVRVTWEGGDATRYARQAARDGVDVVIAGGGDGTINEIVNGLLSEDTNSTSALGILPYGTANDFATSCGIQPGDPAAALRRIAEAVPTPIDVGQVNDRHFINVASGGFGAEVTAATPPQMKRTLGGVAYPLMGLITASRMSPHHGKVTTPDGVDEGQMVLAAVGNGRQAGGGFPVCPKALLNDGLLDVMVIQDVSLLEFGVLLNELMNMDAPENQHVSYHQLPWLEVEMERELHLNLDGEPLRGNRFRFGVLPERLNVILPPDTELIQKHATV